MDDVHIEVSRVNDRDQVLAALAKLGHEGRATEVDGWPAIEVPCGDEEGRACADLAAELETVVGELAVPLVPVQGEGVVYLRPPAG
jgi:hypothetical protein